MIYELIRKNRTYRRFHQEVAIHRTDLEELIDLARLSSSGANLQSLKYVLSCDPETNGRIFPLLKWAGYLPEWNGPEEGERPSAYLVMLLDKDISSNCLWDHGIACQSILLGACEMGLGGCMFGSVDRDGLRASLKIPESYDILLVIALGKPKEKVVLEELNESGSVKYWRDAKKVHHVPKRKLQDLILKL